MTKLNGSVRLWIVLSILMLAATLWARSTWYPMRVEQGNYYNLLDDALQCDAYWQRLHTQDPIKVPKNCYAKSAAQAQDNLSMVRKALADDFVGVHADRRNWWIISIGIWIAVSLGVLLVGRWVVRGFKPRK